MRATSSPGLRIEVEECVLAEVERAGPEGLKRVSIMKRFKDRGVSEATLYRWIDATIASGKPGQAVARKVQEAATARAARTDDPVADVVADVKDRLPVIVRVDDLGSGNAVNVLDRLARVMGDVELLVQHAKTGDGKVRNARLLLVSSAELRKCLETSVKFYAAMRETAQSDRLQEAILDEIAKASPEVAEAIYRRIDHIAATWMG